VSVLTGEPEYLDPLKDESPNGWIVTGYPWYGIQTPEHKAFFLAYQGKYKDHPRLGSVVGYSTIQSLAEGIRKAKSTDTEKLIAAMEGMSFETPKGTMTFRKEDHQALQVMYHWRMKKDPPDNTDLLELVREIPADELKLPIKNKR
jgi:branched-chain amino acid transport system substrate-binding protein